MAKVATKKKKGEPSRARKSDAWDKAFGRRLANARGAMSQQEMADYLGVPLNTYQKWEKGDRTFPKDLIEKVVTKTRHGPWLLLTGNPDHLCPACSPPERTPPRIVSIN